MTSRTIFLDTETTGLSPSYARIIEIAAIEVDNDYQPIRLFHEHLDPKQSVGISNQSHGLDDAFLMGRKTFRDIADNFVEFIDDATLYAHDMRFDQRFLDFELGRCHLNKLETYAEPVDTMPWARAKVMGSAKLEDLMRRFGFGAGAPRHGALVDVEMLIRVFLCLAGQKERALALDFTDLNRKDALYQDSCRLVAAPEDSLEDNETP